MFFHPPDSIIWHRYKVVGRPLTGGMGVVYMCLEGDGLVALKTLRPEYLSDKDSRDRFLREGTTWMELGFHPNIVTCISVIKEDLEVFLVLEWVPKDPKREGSSLRTWLASGQTIGTETAILFGLQIASGMKHAVKTIPGLVHRDLKPENVLVGADTLPWMKTNRVRITDFGLIRVLEGTSEPNIDIVNSLSSLRIENRAPLTHGIIGTPFYMAPEQWKGEPVGTYTDVYAFGCILYEMLTGKQAVHGDDYLELREAHCGGSAQKKAGMLPEPMRKVVSDCLVVNGSERMQNWEEVEEALENIFTAVTGKPAPPRFEREINWKDITPDMRVLEGSSYNTIGSAYQDIGNEKLAKTYFERALEIAQSIENRELEGVALGNLGIVHKKLGNIPESVEYFERSRVILHEIGDEIGEARTIGHLGDFLASVGKHKEAFEYYKMQLAIYQSIGYKVGEALNAQRFSRLHYERGDVRKALQYLEQALSLFKELKDPQGVADCYNGLGIFYGDVGDMKQAIEYFKAALSIWQQLADASGEGQALGNLAHAYTAIGNKQEAIKCFTQALEIDREIGHLHQEAVDLNNMAGFYAKEGDFKKALPLAKKAVELFHQTGDETHAQMAEAFATFLQNNEPTDHPETMPISVPPASLIKQYYPLIDAIVSAALGDQQAQKVVEEVFDLLDQKAFKISPIIRQIWLGERDENILTKGLDEIEVLIVQEILNRLEENM